MIDITITSISVQQLNELQSLTDEIEGISEPIGKQREIADQMQFIRHNMIHLERRAQGNRIRRKTREQDDSSENDVSADEKDLERLKYRLGALENELAAVDSARQKRYPLLDNRRALLDDVSVPVVIPFKIESQIIFHKEQINAIKDKFGIFTSAKNSFMSAVNKLKRIPALLAEAKTNWHLEQANTNFFERKEYLTSKLSKTLAGVNKDIRGAETTLKEVDFSGENETIAIPRLDSAFHDFIHGWSRMLLNASVIDRDEIIQSQIHKLNKRRDDIDHIKQIFQNEQALIENEIEELIVESETVTARKLIETGLTSKG